ncbi:TPA: DUF551 domain-containing protein [Cronobacter sakazakii]|nr:DUF551 domain-containing protein [Cronobacter sakazakii]HCC0190483.1 DUF551 domain-containing protein [Cronobacter sakazakii]HCC0204342.1 DUF551 domain-containing protein [Cronobacter sakazakii]HCC0210230.1 DUF551 domain-containing protein [Cronobacter sakazakii]HCC0214586.1 DUF551 domain-containing protein [Cronobacter sakazakii]
MSTISNELVKDLRMAFSVWQQDYDPVEDKAQYDMFGLGIVAMDELLALRKERELAEPDFYVVVTSVGVWQSFHRSRAEAEFIVNKPFNPGYSVLEIYTAPPAPVVADDSLPYDPQIAEYEQMMEAEQAQADTTSQQCESLAGKAVSGWIPSSERLPDLKQEILCVNQWGEVEAAIYDVGYIPGEPFFATSAGEFYPTHWHALPELPCK